MTFNAVQLHKSGVNNSMYRKMLAIKLPEVQLPSNRKFGIFFTLVFSLVALYFFIYESYIITISSILISLILICITILNPDILFPLNKAWMNFGLILGLVVSPLVLGLIFFGLFTPISLLMRTFKRDELRLRLKGRESHWIIKTSSMRKRNEFTQQF